MSNKKRIEELKAEIARLEKEDEFHPYLAWVSNEKESPLCTKRLALIISYSGESYPFRDHEFNYWQFATPLTRSEVLPYLLPVKSKYDWDAILKEYPEAQVAVRNKDNSFCIGTYREVDVWMGGWEGHGEGLWQFSDRKHWILDRDCDWRDSIEYRRDVQ